MLSHVIEAVSRAVLREQVIIATSLDSVDDPIVEYCRDHGLCYFRGDNANVASRFVAIGEAYHPQWLLRVSGDSPLLASEVIGELVRRTFSTRADMITTVGANGAPSGSHAEIFRTEKYLTLYPSFSSDEEFEHVTQFCYTHPELLQIEAVEFARPNSELLRQKLSVDTEAEFLAAQAVIESFGAQFRESTLAEKCERINHLRMSREGEC